MTGKFLKFLQKWRYNSVLAPIYAGWMAFWGVWLIFVHDEYNDTDIYRQLFSIIPFWLWGLINITAALLVLHRDTPTRMLIQSIVVLTEGVSILVASFSDGNSVPPLTGARVIVVAFALWTLAIRTVMGAPPYYNRRK
jgi:hypothetical protein